MALNDIKQNVFDLQKKLKQKQMAVDDLKILLEQETSMLNQKCGSNLDTRLHLDRVIKLSDERDTILEQIKSIETELAQIGK